MNSRRRAHSLEEYLELNDKIFGTVEREQSTFELRPTDVVITPYSKSGTTWLQQIFHTLRTRGDMDFEDISCVVPWIEVSPRLEIDLNAEQKADPRGFKSHLAYDHIPKGGKYINSVRNPKDVAWSLYKFMEGWFIEPGTVSADEFVRDEFLKSGHYWTHLLSWWPRRNDGNVLFLAYELMKTDLTGTIQRVAEFCDIELDDELLQLTEHHASLAFMQTHKDRFDEALLRDLTEQEHLPPGSDSAKVRTGQVGEHKQGISADVLTALDDKWQQEIEPVIGVSSYDELLTQL